MTILKGDYDHYLSAKRTVKNLEAMFLPYVQEIAFRMTDFRPGWISFDVECVWYARREDSDTSYKIPVKWLFDPDWKTLVDNYLEEMDRRWKEKSYRLAEDHRKRAEASELAELKRLKEKYPEKA